MFVTKRKHEEETAQTSLLKVSNLYSCIILQHCYINIYSLTVCYFNFAIKS
jgi:hypothetical protein